MSIDSFIAELKRRSLISDRLSAKLRDKLAETDRPLSARAVAKFLVQKKHLSQRHANSVLDALTARGEEVDAVPDADGAVARTGHSAPTPPAGEADGGGAASGRPHEESPESPAQVLPDDDDPESSSIFAPFLTGIHKKTETAPSAEDAVDELTLAPPDDTPHEPATPADPAQLSNIEDLAELSASKSSSSDPDLMTDPLVAQVNLSAGSSSLRPPSSIRLKAAKAQARTAREAAKRAVARRRRDSRSRKKPRPKAKNEWDSPLILIGSGALVLMLLLGTVVWWLIGSETGDDKLRDARAAVDAGSYTQAIEHYRQFLADHPRHSDASLARVQLGMARLRRDTEAGRFSTALETAKAELREIEREETFAEAAHAELAALLPRIAEGLASAAEATTDPEQAAQYVEQATAALSLCGITRYIPRRFRDETQLDGVRQILARVERRQKSHHELQQAIQAIETAIADGDTRAAYAAHRQVLRDHPELSGNVTLAELVREAAAAEQAAIRYVADEQPAETAQRSTPWVATLALAHRQPNAPALSADGSQRAVCVRAGNAIYGLDVASGKLLWRRSVGYAGDGWPVTMGDHVLVTDSTHYELLCLEAATGRLRWRQAFDEPFAPPLVTGNRAFVASESGRLYVLDATSGTRMGFLEFGQPLTVTPAVDRRGERLYLVGEQFNIYAISLTDLACLGVYYLGHPQGSIEVSPANVLNKLAVLVNDGVETCRLHLLSLDESGAVSEEVSTQRLRGLAGSAPAAAGRRLIVVTDRGQLNVYDIGASQGQPPLTLVATREPTSRQPLTRHMAVTDRHIWLGDDRLTKLAIAPTGNRLPVESTDNSYAGATFDHPLARFDRTLIHAHRPKERPGVVVAAMDTDHGRVLWETELSMPPVSAPIVDSAAKALTVATASGHVFRFDEHAIRSRVQDQPLASSAAPSPTPTLTDGVDLGAGRAAFWGSGQPGVVALYDPSQGDGTLQWAKLPGPLACRVVPFHEGVLAPLQLGQVLYINPQNGRPLALPFQPQLQPRTTFHYQPPGSVDSHGRQFLITDGREKLYLVELKDHPEPHLQAVTEGSVGPFPIVSPIFVLGDVAMAVTEQSDVIRFRLPSLEAFGEIKVPAGITWGPFLAGDRLLLATADDQLLALTASGDVAWQVPLEAGDLAGPPWEDDGQLLLAYRGGILERRALADGELRDNLDTMHPLAAGPVRFLQHLVLTAADGTLLVVEAP